jgi:hypothetical protein
MSNQRSGARHGALVICVLVCLLVASTIVTATTHLALRSRRDVRIEQQMRQTELLLDAGILRAARQLKTPGDYESETWRPTDAVSRFDNARVDIRVTVDEQVKGSLRVEVIASLGVAVDDVQQKTASLTRRSHSFRVKPSNSSLASDSSDSESSNPDFSNAE